MPRTFSANGLRSLFAETTDQIWLVLLTITTKTNTFRFVNNNEDVTSNGQVFQYFPFDITPPGDDMEATPAATLTIDNVDQMLVDELRSVQEPPKFTIQVIRHDEPDLIELEVDDLVMRQVSWDALTITATLELDDIFNQPFPSGSGVYSPRQFPGMF